MSAKAFRVAIRTLGCKVNRTESETLAESLLGASCSVVDETTDADVVVVNTCTVTGEADSKARKEVRRALASCAGPVIVTGCLAALDADGLRSLGERVVVEPDRTALLARVRDVLGLETAVTAEPARREAGEVFRTRVMVKVQDGCDHRCSYCIVPDARGVPRSVPANEVLARAGRLVSSGTTEVVLTGINIGRYADEGAGASGLPQLVAMLSAAGVPRIRISSIEPLDVDDEFAALLATTDRVVPHLHIPLQSGCDATLAEMRRGYTSADFAGVLSRVRDARPGLAITTDVIVGFPGETDEDFAASLRFVEACGFSRLHVFRYSRRAGTPAAARTDQVPAPVIASRAAAMRALSDRLFEAWLLQRDGGAASVLVERVSADMASGTTEDGIHVELPACGAQPGDIVAVTLRLGAVGMGADRNDAPPEDSD